MKSSDVKVGGTYRIRQWDDMEAEFGMGGCAGRGSINTDFSFTEPMRDLCGKVVTVDSISPTIGRINTAEDVNGYFISADMLELISEDIQEVAVVEEKVVTEPETITEEPVATESPKVEEPIKAGDTVRIKPWDELEKLYKKDAEDNFILPYGYFGASKAHLCGTEFVVEAVDSDDEIYPENGTLLGWGCGRSHLFVNMVEKVEVK